MALQKVNRNLLNTGVSDSSDATAVTIDSSENVTLAGSLTATTSVTAASGFLGGSNGGIRIHSGGTKFFNITAANAARDNIMDIGASDARFKDLYLGGKAFMGGMTLTSNDAGRIGLNRNPDNGSHVNSSSLQRFQINGPYTGGDFLQFQNYDSSGNYTGGFRIDDGAIRAAPLGVSTPSYAFDNDTDTGMTRPTGDTLQFVTGGSQAMRINSSRQILMNTSDAHNAGPEILHVTTSGGSSAGYGINIKEGASGGGTMLRFNVAGSIVGQITTGSSATTYHTSSDARLKDITGKARGLEVINELNPVSYTWKKDGSADEGFIAQEVEKLIPNVVHQGGDDETKNPWSMDYGRITPLLVKAIQEQQAVIEDLKTRIETLEG